MLTINILIIRTSLKFYILLHFIITIINKYLFNTL